MQYHEFQIRIPTPSLLTRRASVNYNGVKSSDNDDSTEILLNIDETSSRTLRNEVPEALRWKLQRKKKSEKEVKATKAWEEHPRLMALLFADRVAP